MERISVLTVLVVLCWATLAGADDSVQPFELPNWEPQRATRTPWTRFLNAFDIDSAAGRPDFYRGSGFTASKVSYWRNRVPGRFDIGAGLYKVRDKRTQMLYRMGRNCPVYQATIELFVRSQDGINIWNDGKAHHVFHLYGARGPRLKGKPTVSLIKTAGNRLVYQCQGKTISLATGQLKADQWYHLAVSWDTKVAPGRLWMTINGKGVTAEPEAALQRVSYEYLVIGNSPRDTSEWEKRGLRYGDQDEIQNRRRVIKFREKNAVGDTDIFPLEATIDELHISEETLADRLPERQKQLAELPIDWELYQQAEGLLRLLKFHQWPNQLPLNTSLGNKYGSGVGSGATSLRLYEAFGDLWFLDQAERIGQIALMAQRPEGHFCTGFLFVAGDKGAYQLGPTETGLEKVEPAPWCTPHFARIQDGYQDGPMNYLISLYRASGKKEYLDAARRVVDMFIEAQNPNGSWSGEYDVKTKKGHIADSKKVYQGGEFDDGAIDRPLKSLLLMYHVTGDEKYLEPIGKCLDWILEAEIVGSGARGWAGFYDANNNPVQARKHEYPKIMTQVFTANVGKLMIWGYHVTGDRKYLDGIRPALKWYQEHKDPERKGWAAFYENDGTLFTPSDYYTATGWYEPQYTHFRDVTYIQNAIDKLDKGELRPPPAESFKVTPEALAEVRTRALEQVRSPGMLRWVKQSIQLIPQMEWTPGRPRLEPHLYGLRVSGRIGETDMINYLYAARVLADKVPASIMVSGTGRNWLIEDKFDTPLRKTK